jgi:hypothetical protein
MQNLFTIRKMKNKVRWYKTDRSKDISNNSDFLASLEKEEKGESRLDRIIKVWGKIFRPIFIISIGIGSFSLIKTDFLYIPFSKLTLKDIIGGVIPILMLLLCFTWLLDKSKDRG